MSQQDTNPAIVTGAAGGMGSATARAFSAEGRPLILCDLHEEPLQELARELEANGKVEILPGDVSDPAYPASLVRLLGDREVGALVHTAGLSPAMAEGPRIVEVNFGATKRLVEALLPKMAEGACAVLIASIAAHSKTSPEFEAAVEDLIRGIDSPGVRKFSEHSYGGYGFSKRAIVRFAQEQATPFGRRGARIVSLCPGIIDTSMGRLEQAQGPTMDKMLGQTPMGRMGRPEEIASVAMFLCSPGASYMTGCDIRVDGGTVPGMATAAAEGAEAANVWQAERRGS